MKACINVFIPIPLWYRLQCYNERHNEWTTKKQYVYFSVNRQQWRPVSMYSFQSLSGIGYNDNNERHNEWTTKKQYVYFSVNQQQWRPVSMYSFQSLSGIGYNDNNERHNEWTTKKHILFLCCSFIMSFIIIIVAYTREGLEWIHWYKPSLLACWL